MNVTYTPGNGNVTLTGIVPALQQSFGPGFGLAFIGIVVLLPVVGMSAMGMKISGTFLSAMMLMAVFTGYYIGILPLYYLIFTFVFFGLVCSRSAFKLFTSDFDDGPIRSVTDDLPLTPRETIQEAIEESLGEETTGWNCKNCGGPNHHEFCEYCGKARE